MIDWWGLARNALWILGLSLCLAALSMVSYRVRAERIYLRDALSKPGTQRALGLGLLLFCLGILVTSRTWWQLTVSGLLVVLVVGQFLQHWRKNDHGAA